MHWARALPILGRQFRNAVLLLLAATILVAYFLGDRTDAVSIGVILAVSVGLGSARSTGPARAAEALHSTVRHTAVVLRDKTAGQRDNPARDRGSGASERAVDAGRFAAEEARRRGAPLYLVTAVPWPYGGLSAPARPRPAALLRQGGEAVVRSAAGAVGGPLRRRAAHPAALTASAAGRSASRRSRSTNRTTTPDRDADRRQRAPVFPGRLDKARLTFGERAMATAMRAPVGDFRDWSAVGA